MRLVFQGAGQLEKTRTQIGIKPNNSFNLTSKYLAGYHNVRRTLCRVLPTAKARTTHGGKTMNFDFVKNRVEKHDGYTLTLEGDYEIDILAKIVKACGEGNMRQGTVTYFSERDKRFTADIFCFA